MVTCSWDTYFSIWKKIFTQPKSLKKNKQFLENGSINDTTLNNEQLWNFLVDALNTDGRWPFRIKSLNIIQVTVCLQLLFMISTCKIQDIFFHARATPRILTMIYLRPHVIQLHRIFRWTQRKSLNLGSEEPVLIN